MSNIVTLQSRPASLQAVFDELIKGVELASTIQQAAAQLRAALLSVQPFLVLRPDLEAMRAKSLQTRAAARANEKFYIQWAGCEGEIIIGWKALAKKLNYKESTLAVMFSKGKGWFELPRENPKGNLDSMTVSRSAKPAKPKRGRPVGTLARPKKTQAQELKTINLGPLGNKLRAVYNDPTDE